MKRLSKIQICNLTNMPPYKAILRAGSSPPPRSAENVCVMSLPRLPTRRGRSKLLLQSTVELFSGTATAALTHHGLKALVRAICTALLNCSTLLTYLTKDMNDQSILAKLAKAGQHVNGERTRTHTRHVSSSIRRANYLKPSRITV